jgi:hypothetical protein
MNAWIHFFFLAAIISVAVCQRYPPPGFGGLFWAKSWAMFLTYAGFYIATHIANRVCWMQPSLQPAATALQRVQEF